MKRILVFLFCGALMLNLSASPPTPQSQVDELILEQNNDILEQLNSLEEWDIDSKDYLASNEQSTSSQDTATADETGENQPAESVTVQEALEALKQEWAKRPEPGSPWREWIGYLVGAIGLAIGLFRGNRPKKE